MDIEAPGVKRIRELTWSCPECGLTLTMHRYLSPRRPMLDSDKGDCDPKYINRFHNFRPGVYLEGGGI